MAETGLALSTRGLKKSYGSRLALDGLDLTVPTGVVYGFLGPNGAGKTTTMRLLTGLIHPDGGAIEVLGKPFTRRDRRRLFDVGALVESPAFYPYLSGRENLRALAASGAPVPVGRVDEVLELVGLRERSGDKVSRYSLGMKQRLGIIAAGRLVREGTMQELLAAEGVVRVKVAPDEVPAAATALGGLVDPGLVAPSTGEPGWISVQITPDRSAEVNRALGEAGIWVSGLASGNDLEELFLTLTGAASAEDPDGTFASIDRSAGGGASTGTPS